MCYKTTVTVDSRWKLFWIIPMGKVETYDFYFSVSNTGVVSIDNTQQNVQLLCKRESQHIAMEFVEEVFRVAQAQVPFALEGRTVEGVLLEIYAHYMGYCLNYKPSHTATTDIGSNVVSNPGYDYNAEWFE